jgi:sugar O-acyltransferase (sialic acid O-acetyltransferase NeuD family)
VPRPLLLAGAGGFARETAEAVRAINAVCPTWDLVGFLDDDPAAQGRVVGGLEVVGPLDAIAEHPGAQLVLCTGRPDAYDSRARIARRLGLDDERYATIVHPSASVGSTCALGAGAVLLAHVAATADVQVGRHVAVMPQVVLTHDVRVGDFATVASGVRIGGSCRIGAGAYLGSGACLREGVAVGDGALVGMGAVVTRDVRAHRTVVGVPARDRGPAPVAAAEATAAASAQP